MNTKQGTIAVLLWTAVLAIATPASAQLRGQQLRDIDVGAVVLTWTSRTIDACRVATTAQLQTLVSAGLGSIAIEHHDGGDHVWISNLRLSSLTCPDLAIQVRADIRYKRTRGLIQGSASGDVRFRSPLVARLTTTEPIHVTATPSPEQVASAVACLTSIEIVGLNLKNVPNWLDSGWIRDLLNSRLGGGQLCVDVTPYVKMYLAQGGTLAIAPDRDKEVL